MFFFKESLLDENEINVSSQSSLNTLLNLKSYKPLAYLFSCLALVSQSDASWIYHSHYSLFWEKTTATTYFM